MTSSDLLEKAKNAIANGDEGASEKLYEEIIKAIETQVGKNQKDIASELQKIARALESEGQIDHAFLFKQRTCATMLRLSMEERRGSRTITTRTTLTGLPPMQASPPRQPGAPVASPAPSNPSATLQNIPALAPAGPKPHSQTLGKLEFICMPTDDPERSMALYQKAVDAKQTGQAHTLSIGGSIGGTLVFVDRWSPGGPVFRVQHAEAVADRLAESGFTRHPTRLSTPHGLVVFLIDFAGNTFGLLEG